MTHQYIVNPSNVISVGVYKTREEWLEAGAARLAPEVAAAYGCDELPPVKVTCGFPSRNALARRRQRIGECWPVEAGNGHAQILITPTIMQPLDVLAVLVHELIHAADRNENGHRKPFIKAARKLGLEGKVTSTVPGEALRQRLEALAAELGEYPHPGLTATSKVRTQSTRMLKLVCPACGLIIRAARRSIEDHSAPEHCGEHMEFAHEGGPRAQERSTAEKEKDQ